MFIDIDFGKCVSKKYIDFDINKNIPLEEQLDLLKEDLLQVSYENSYIIDVGWYPEFDEKGSFKVSVIKDCKWDNVIIQKSCRDLNLLAKYLYECIKLIQAQQDSQ